MCIITEAHAEPADRTSGRSDGPSHLAGCDGKRGRGAWMGTRWARRAPPKPFSITRRRSYAHRNPLRCKHFRPSPFARTRHPAEFESRVLRHPGWPCAGLVVSGLVLARPASAVRVARRRCATAGHRRAPAGALAQPVDPADVPDRPWPRRRRGHPRTPRSLGPRDAPPYPTHPRGPAQTRRLQPVLADAMAVISRIPQP